MCAWVMCKHCCKELKGANATWALLLLCSIAGCTRRSDALQRCAFIWQMPKKAPKGICFVENGNNMAHKPLCKDCLCESALRNRFSAFCLSIVSGASRRPALLRRVFACSCCYFALWSVLHSLAFPCVIVVIRFIIAYLWSAVQILIPSKCTQVPCSPHFWRQQKAAALHEMKSE
jgi:hypothetical protein